MRDEPDQTPHETASLPTVRQSEKDEGLTTVSQTALWLANFTSPRTRRTYQNAVREFVAYAGITAEADFAAIGPEAVIAWREQMIGEGLSNRTIGARLAALSSLYKHLRETQQVPTDPVAGIKRPKVNARRVEALALAPAEVRRLLDAPPADTLQGLRDRALLAVYFYTGARVSEPASLRVRDFQMDRGYCVLDYTKKGGERHRVAIHPECQAAIRAYLDAAPHAGDPEAWLFQQMFNGRPGRPVTARQFRNLFMKYARQVGLPAGVTPHSARATLITEALERDHPVEAVQATVGHASVTTTLKYDKREQNPRRSASFVVKY